MMKIVRAKSMGYCMGVKRAVQLAEENLMNNNSLTSLGLLIHNEIENQRLAKLGLTFANVDELTGADKEKKLLIRAHGLDPQVQDRLRTEGYQLIDATCPLVVLNQKDVQKARKAGYYIVILGKPEHAEIIAMKGFADDKRLSIISSEEEARALAIDEEEIFLLSQTTLRPDLYLSIKSILSQRYRIKEYRPSICPATQERQEAVKALAEEVEVIVVVGDRNSANTKGLLESALKAGVDAYLVSNAQELVVEDIAKYSIVGLTAGASVPDYVVDDVEQVLQNIAIKK